MRYGFYLPTRGALATGSGIETLVQRAEALGYDSLVIGDHIVMPVKTESKYPYTVSGAFSGDASALEQLTLMAFVAAKTRTMRLITSVMIVPHRNPVVTAKSLATIDVLSGGRVVVGVGVGWQREEFEALGAPPFDRRGVVSDEYLRIFKTLWTEAPARYAGEFYRFDDVWCLPQPLQRPHPPIWVGGHSRSALRRVARLGDGWHPVGANPASPLRPDEMRAKLAELRQLVEAEGRDPASITISYKAPLYDTTLTGGALDAGGQERRPFSGTTAQIVEDIGVYADLGVSELILDFRGERLGESLDRMEHFATEIRSRAPA